MSLEYEQPMYVSRKGDLSGTLTAISDYRIYDRRQREYNLAADENYRDSSQSFPGPRDENFGETMRRAPRRHA